MNWLFCFPYAGGNSTFYKEFKTKIKSVTVQAFNYAGHSSRFCETQYNSPEDVIDDMIDLVLKKAKKDDTIFLLGYSMGAWVAYEVARKLTYTYDFHIKKIILCAANAPGHHEEAIHELPQSDFVNKLKEFGGMPEEVLQNKELLELVLPSIINDFRLCYEYTFDMNIPLLKCPIIAIHSDEELYANEWSQYSSGKATVHHFEGNHFFILDKFDDTLQIINDEITSEL